MGKSQKYKKISHADRINLIYERATHKVPVNRLSKLYKVPANTIWNIVQSFEATGRTNKKQYWRSSMGDSPTQLSGKVKPKLMISLVDELSSQMINLESSSSSRGSQDDLERDELGCRAGSPQLKNGSDSRAPGQGKLSPSCLPSRRPKKAGFEARNLAASGWNERGLNLLLSPLEEKAPPMMSPEQHGSPRSVLAIGERPISRDGCVVFVPPVEDFREVEVIQSDIMLAEGDPALKSSDNIFDGPLHNMNKLLPNVVHQ